MNKNLIDIFNILTVGTSLAIVFYWAGILLGRIGTNSSDFKWWLRIIIPQGIVMALVLKLFKVF